MNLRMTVVLIVMTLAVLAALFPTPPDETVLVAVTSGAAAARTGRR